MTEAERQTVIFSAFAAIRRLVPSRRREDVDHHLAAVTAAFNEQSAVAYDKGWTDGALSVEMRTDRRDIECVEHPRELRSVH